MKPLVSIIVPVYNVVKYLHRCVDSLLAQTYEPIEIILVDDGSTDGSAELCDDYAKDSRIRVVHQENRGLSVARNTGLDMMHGDFLMFVDSDDYVDQRYVEAPMGLVDISFGGDIVCFPHYEDIQGKRRLARSSCYDSSPKTVFEALKALLADEIAIVAFGKLYRANIWKNLRFPCGKIHEDVYAIPHAFAAASAILFLDEPLYFYNRDNMTSITNSSGNNMRGMVDMFVAHVENEIVAQKLQDEAFLRTIRVKCLQDAIRLYYRNYNYGDMSERDYEILIDCLHKPWVCDVLPYCRLERRVQFWLMMHMPALASWYGKWHYAANKRNGRN